MHTETIVLMHTGTFDQNYFHSAMQQPLGVPRVSKEFNMTEKYESV